MSLLRLLHNGADLVPVGHNGLFLNQLPFRALRSFNVSAVLRIICQDELILAWTFWKAALE